MGPKPKVTFKKQLLTKLCEITDFFPSVLVMFQYFSVLKLAKVSFLISRRPSLFPTQIFFFFFDIQRFCSLAVPRHVMTSEDDSFGSCTSVAQS